MRGADLRLPDMSGFEVFGRLRAHNALADIPVVVFTGRELSAEEDAQIHTMARSIVVRARESPERSLNVLCAVHAPRDHRSAAREGHALERLNSSDEDWSAAPALVDDDPRHFRAVERALNAAASTC